MPQFLINCIMYLDIKTDRTVPCFSRMLIGIFLSLFKLNALWMSCFFWLHSEGMKQELRDREKSHELYLQVKSEVESCIAYLKENREKDPYRNILPRLLYQAGRGFTSEVPTFELWLHTPWKANSIQLFLQKRGEIPLALGTEVTSLYSISSTMAFAHSIDCETKKNREYRNLILEYVEGIRFCIILGYGRAV